MPSSLGLIPNKHRQKLVYSLFSVHCSHVCYKSLSLWLLFSSHIQQYNTYFWLTIHFQRILKHLRTHSPCSWKSEKQNMYKWFDLAESEHPLQPRQLQKYHQFTLSCWSTRKKEKANQMWVIDRLLTVSHSLLCIAFVLVTNTHTVSGEQMLKLFRISLSLFLGRQFR